MPKGEDGVLFCFIIFMIIRDGVHTTKSFPATNQWLPVQGLDISMCPCMGLCLGLCVVYFSVWEADLSQIAALRPSWCCNLQLQGEDTGAGDGVGTRHP